MKRKSSRPSRYASTTAREAAAVAAGVDALRPQAERLELRDLVVHERDQGRDDERRAAAGEAGELVAERLAGAGGHDEQHVLAVHHRAAHRLLVRPERGQAEAVAEEGGETVVPRSSVVPGDEESAGGGAETAASLARGFRRARGCDSVPVYRSPSE